MVVDIGNDGVEQLELEGNNLERLTGLDSAELKDFMKRLRRIHKMKGVETVIFLHKGMKVGRAKKHSGSIKSMLLL